MLLLLLLAFSDILIARRYLSNCNETISPSIVAPSASSSKVSEILPLSSPTLSRVSEPSASHSPFTHTTWPSPVLSATSPCPSPLASTVTHTSIVVRTSNVLHTSNVVHTVTSIFTSISVTTLIIVPNATNPCDDPSWAPTPENWADASVNTNLAAWWANVSASRGSATFVELISTSFGDDSLDQECGIGYSPTCTIPDCKCLVIPYSGNLNDDNIPSFSKRWRPKMGILRAHQSCAHERID
jgi:hypothetical protein